MEKVRSVLALVNPRSGPVRGAFNAVQREMDRHWDVPGIDLSYQFSRDIEDSVAKTRRAIERGADTILAMGGDGTISTVGRALVGSGVKLGAIPTGSGNGFARHFGIPLSPARAVVALARAEPRRIDVGVVAGHPFLVTCSMAWDASIAESFAKLPVRGFLPYLFAGFQEFLGYRPQAVDVVLDSGEELHVDDPFLFTIANLTQYGGGARIAPHASADDGCLELVVASRQDAPKLVANIGRLFNGTIDQLPEIIFRKFRRMTVRRKHPALIQIDGELVEAPAVIEVSVLPSSLNVLVPVPANRAGARA